MNRQQFVQLAITVVIIIAIMALVYVALPAFGLPVPSWIIHVVWIVIGAFILIAAIRIVGGMGGGTPPS